MIRYVRAIRTQLVIVGVIGTLAVLHRMGLIPTPVELEGSLASIVRRQLLFLAPIALAENLVGFNVYFPGSIAILLGMASTGGHPSLALLAWIAIVLPGVVGQQLSYWLGRTGFARASGPSPTKHLGVALEWGLYAGTMWHPQVASLTSAAAGAEGLSYRHYLSRFLPVFLLWQVFWGALMYSVGASVAKGFGWMLWLFLVYLAAWTILDLHRARSLSSSEQQSVSH